MGALDKVLLAAGLLEPDELGGAHEHLMKACPWYRNISEEKNCGHDPAEHCKPGGKADKVKLTPHTAEASTVPEPIGKPGGPGLWHVKGMQLPPYVQHLAHHLIGKYGESRGIAMAKGIVAKWKAGVAPGGKKGGKPRHVHADVQAAAAKNIAQWEADRDRAHAQSRDHASKQVKASVLDRGVALAQSGAQSAGHDAPFPGQAQIALPPVPGGKAPKSMYTAHRVNDALFHLSHAAQRLAQAKRGKALRSYHMIHVHNHLSRALETAHNLVESVKRNYPPEARELADLTKTMGLSASVSEDAKVATFAHLLQTVLYHLAHAKRHAECMQNPGPDSVWKFNEDHAEVHLKGALEHCYKLADHIRDNYPDEARWLKELGRAEDPADPFTGLSAVRLAQPEATAPGAAPIGKGPPGPGLYQHPAQSLSPSPPLPPGATLPTAAEIRKIIKQVPDCTDASLSQSARNHLDAAAMKLAKDDSLAALHVLRSAQSDIYAAHKADLGAFGPAANTANVFARTVPASERSSANTDMLRSRDQELKWRSLEMAVAGAIDRIRRRHFHGMYGGSPLARFSQEEDMSALDKVLRLAAAVQEEREGRGDGNSALVRLAGVLPSHSTTPTTTPTTAPKPAHSTTPKLDAHQLHVRHVEHVAHVAHLHVEHLRHLAHLAHVSNTARK